jgi:hypothetical protein
MSRGYFQIYVALKLSNVATFPSTLSKHSVNSVQIISTTFIKDSKLIQRACAAGKPIRRRHAHMHSKRSGLNVDLSAELKTNFAWVPPLADEYLEGPGRWKQSLGTTHEIDEAFDSLEKDVAQEGLNDESDAVEKIWGRVGTYKVFEEVT